MSDTVRVERADNIAIVSLHRTEKRNALRREDWIAVGDAMDALGEDDDIRCIVLRGAGDEAFCAGADIAGFEEERSDRRKVKAYEAATDRAFLGVRNSRHPVIAMIHGFCIGGGFELALAADLRISAESGRFGVPAKNIGLFLGYHLVQFLVDAGGRAVAAEILLEGRAISADEALAKNLLTRVVPDAELEDEVMKSARRIANGAPLSHRYHRKVLKRLADPRPLSRAELESQFDYADSEDYMIGYNAFKNRGKPKFRGR
ncbi:MAG: enoyl-CoA hydratase [Alphaproteobacteria bacterium]|nr:enoyl-CoA hydratase [Alphaproteobacteria bacterium]|tara:strand:+ start:1879 stop:2658 length:780 start_codon:yes stop_codon:yes gene_type:complete